MSQRFYPYTPALGEPMYCEAANCTNVASWWESTRDAIWCDFHATSELVAPVRVSCDVCLQWYNPVHIHDGVCVDCRSVMPLMWVDDEVTQ